MTVLDNSSPPHLKSTSDSEMGAVIIVHDMGESSCSRRIKELVQAIYSKKPGSTILTLDYSSLVSMWPEFVVLQTSEF